MSESRADHTKRRLLIQNISSTELLHKGLKRKISQNQYVKLYPRLKLSQKSRTHTVNLYRNECSEEYMHSEVSKMREDNKLLEEENLELRTKMRKENKLNEIFEKRMDQGKLNEMNLDKLLEIKLLMEVEDLQEKLATKEAEVAQLVKKTKRRKQAMEDYNIQAQLDLYALLYSSEEAIIALREQKEQKIRYFHNKHITFHEKISKMRQANKQKTDQLRKLTLSIEKQRVNLPKKSDLATENNDSGIYGLQNRNKNIEQLEGDILKLKDEYSAFEIQIQESIDKKVRQKILLHKEIEDLSTAIVNNANRNNLSTIKTRW